jgi:hypothetical protein
MKKFIFVCMLLAMSLPASAHAQDDAAFVQNFYKWYIAASLPADKTPAFDAAIEKYVCKNTAQRVRLDYERAVVDADYYLKRQDVGKEQLDNLIVGKPLAVNASLSLVPVSMSEKKEYSPDLVVYVEKENGGMCISKVESSPGPNFRGDAY